MKKAADKGTLAPVDVTERYTIQEATFYLRISHVSIYEEINALRLRVLKHRGTESLEKYMLAYQASIADRTSDSPSGQVAY